MFYETYLVAESKHLWLKEKYNLATMTNQENMIVLVQYMQCMYMVCTTSKGYHEYCSQEN